MDKINKTVIGTGFAGLSAAAYLAQAWYSVTAYEKKVTVGGRARQLSANGYVFDMGPSWYWMPEVFEKFFQDFGYQPADFYELEQLNPGFTIVFGQDETLSIPADFEQLCVLFESIEIGSAEKLRLFLKEAAYKYHTGMDKLVYKPCLSLWEFADWDLFKGVFKLQVFTAFSKHVRKFFKNPKLIALMEFPVLFLGAMPHFKADYNSFKGNAYGLANTLMQTAHLKPSIKNKKVKNLFYAGQLTVPGPGVPPSIISGKVSAQLLIQYLNHK